MFPKSPYDLWKEIKLNKYYTIWEYGDAYPTIMHLILSDPN